MTSLSRVDPTYTTCHIPNYLLPGHFDPDRFKEALSYKPRPNDVFIATYPKCGTTYLQQIVYLIYSKGVPPPNSELYFKSCPFLEAKGIKSVIDMPRPNAIKVHLRYDLTPYSSDTKYICMIRNPKDCVVSLYHHTKQIPGYKFSEGACDRFFDLFIESKVEFGSYFDNLKSWYAHKDDPNVLFIHYEETVDNPEPMVLKIAQFLGQEYGDMLRNDNQMLHDIIRYSSFDFMKQQTNSYYEENKRYKVTRVRRGKNGGWRDELTPEQSRLIDLLIEQQLGNDCPDVINVWKKFNCI